MSKMRNVLVFLTILTPTSLLGQNGIPNNYDLLYKSGCVLPEEEIVAVNSEFFAGFSPGGSNDLPANEVARFDEFIAGAGPLDHICFRGTNDAMPWYERYRPKEDHRLDRDLSRARAEWAKERAGQDDAIIILDGEDLDGTDGSNRGFYTFIISTRPRPALDSAWVDQRILNLLPDWASEIAGIDRRLSELEQREAERVRLGVGFGGAHLRAGPAGFTVPTASLAFFKLDPFVAEFVLTGGWRPDGRGRFGKEAQTIANTSITMWPWGVGDSFLRVINLSKLGLTAGLAGGWQVIRSEDEFRIRTYGPFAGLRYVFGGDPLLVSLGFDAHYTNVNLLERGDETWWQVGFSPSIRIAVYN